MGDNIQKHQVIDDNGLAIEGNNVVMHDNHHVIASLDEIFVQRDSTKYSAEWEPIFSDMQKDIAVLKVKRVETISD